MVGGCCGSTPPHIKAIREMSEGYKSCKLPDVGCHKMRLSGHEDLVVEYVHNHLCLPFLKVGKMCNIISGSMQFKKRVMACDYGTWSCIGVHLFEAGSSSGGHAHTVTCNFVNKTQNCHELCEWQWEEIESEKNGEKVDVDVGFVFY